MGIQPPVCSAGLSFLLTAKIPHQVRSLQSAVWIRDPFFFLDILKGTPLRFLVKMNGAINRSVGSIFLD